MPDNRDLEQPEDSRLDDDEEIVGTGEDEDEFGDEEDLEKPIDEEPPGMSSAGTVPATARGSRRADRS